MSFIIYKLFKFMQSYPHNMKLFNFTFRLTHPNIVQLLETYEDKSKVYLVMELYVTLT